MSSLPLSKVFATLPDELRDSVITAFNSVRRNYVERRWEPSELNGGKVSEAVYRVLEWYTSSTNTYTQLGAQIKDFGVAVRRFEKMSSMPDSVRFHIPNALAFLYAVRNKRGVGHLGGDINSNHMDAEAVLGITNWMMAELIRILHGADVAEAQQTVEEMVEKRSPLIWEVADRKRILNSALSYRDRVLVLLHNSYPNPIDETELFEWCEHSNPSAFRSQVLKKAHKERLIEYDPVKRLVYLSPSGVELAEQLLLRHNDIR